MVSEDLIYYVRQQKKNGYVESQLKPVMIDQGYSEQDIEDAFDATTPGAIKERNVVVGLLLTIFTFGFYSFYWLASTSRELKENDADAPSPHLFWLLILFPIAPLVLIYYAYRYSSALEEVTSFSKWGMFLLLLFFYPAGYVLAQLELNRHAN